MLKRMRHTLMLTLMLAMAVTVIQPGQAEAYQRTGDMDAVSLAKKLVGDEYTVGGENPDEGFNSSGLTYFIFNQLGYDYPRSLKSQSRYGNILIKDRKALKYGDALFFGTSGDPYFTAIYIGNGYFVTASKTQDKVVKKRLSDYMDQFLGARRVLSKDDHLKVELVLRARLYLGTPYVFGAKYGQTRTFDCSSFVKTVFAKQAGITLPRVSRDQAREGVYVKKANLEVGDLVFFSTPPREKYSGIKKIGHVGMYVGNGQMIHTYGEGGVKYSSITSGYWSKKYITARRVL